MFMTNTMDEVPRLLLRIEEAARMCGLSRSKLYELIGSGRIECVRIEPVTEDSDRSGEVVRSLVALGRRRSRMSLTNSRDCAGDADRAPAPWASVLSWRLHGSIKAQGGLNASWPGFSASL